MGALLEPFPISGWHLQRRAYARARRALTTDEGPPPRRDPPSAAATGPSWTDAQKRYVVARAIF
eukprot:583718-Pyramimonas_sp.AAC.1